MNELRRLMTEYKEANTQFYDCLKMGDTRWDLYNKQMKATWKKIQIELDSVSTLPLKDIQVIADIAKEQADDYCKDCINLYSRFNTGDKR